MQILNNFFSLSIPNPFSGITLRKATLFTLFLAAVSGCAVPPPLADRVTIEKFPPYLHHLPKNGVLPNSLGTSLCKIDETFPLLSECDLISQRVHDFVIENHLQDYSELKSSCGKLCDDGILNMGAFDDAGRMKTITLGFNPQVISNQKKALTYLEKTVLQNHQFFDQDSSKIVEEIKHTHCFLSEKLTNPDNQKPGHYRTKPAIITPPSTHETEDLLKMLRQTGASSNEIKIFRKFWNNHLSGKPFVPSTTELKIAKKIIFFPLMPDEVPSAMLNLANEMKDLAKNIKIGTQDPVDAAAYVLWKMGEIHPFADGNGRLGRAWMNVFLQLGGIDAIIFPNDEIYTQIHFEEQKNPGSIAAYIRDTIEWNQNQENLHDWDPNLLSLTDEL